MYTAVVLSDTSVEELKSRFADDIPAGWAIKCHHMTCNMGRADHGPAANTLGENFDLWVTHIGKDDLVIACAVECAVPSANEQKHVTLAVNEAAGGKAKMSNNLVDWSPVERFLLRGVVTEVN